MNKKDLYKELQSELKTIHRLSKLDEPNEHGDYKNRLRLAKLWNIKFF
jgi:hypothetical protein